MTTTFIPNKFYFRWHQLYDPHRKSDIFYVDRGTSSPVVDITFNDKMVQITCDGEMMFTYNGYRIRKYDDLMDSGLVSDKEWNQVDIHDGLYPWFDAYEYNEDNNEWIHLDMVNGDLDDIILEVQRYILETTQKVNDK